MADKSSALQDGIYLAPGPIPKAFRFVVFDVLPGTERAAAREAIARVWEILAGLRAGTVRDLEATRPDEQSVSIDGDTFDVLIGFGASFFDSKRGLTAADRPHQLTALGHPGSPFQSLGWAPGVAARSGEGDLCLQLIGRDEHAVDRAAVEVWKAIVDDALPLVVRETFDGFARDDGRSWIGFHDGVSNIRQSQRRAAVESTGDPDWNRGGTYLAFLRCEVDLVAWRGISRDDQEILVGRDKLTGHALERVESVDGKLVPRAFAVCPAVPGGPLEQSDVFHDPPETGDPLVEASHVHRANQNRAEPTSSAAHRIFRQGYEYLEDVTADGPRLGLNFVSFQRDLEHLRQILTIPSWLGSVNFGGVPRGPNATGPDPIHFIHLRAGGFYAIPPRAEPFPGAGLLG
ncbi:MAG: Dyp-type peroxidase [Actinomycetota bacterium]|nr:Dyp-type peroxidase [Actinomycetota bacterium]